MQKVPTNKERYSTMLFYDFEVFKEDWLVVVIDMNEKKEYVIVNSKEELEALYEANKYDIWVGFNSRHYDQYLLKGILCGFNPKKVNDWIIIKGKNGWQYSSLFNRIPLNNYDVMLNTDRGLKVFEGFMGNNIKETEVPFDIDRKLTQEEIEQTIFYCRHDVEQTIEIFLKRIDEFNVMMYFIRHFEYPLSYISKTKPQLAAEMLGGNRKGADFDDEFQFPILDCLDLKKYKFVADWYRMKENQDYAKKQKSVIVAGVEHNFSWGGAHGALTKYSAKGYFIMIDVTAYYPSMQKRYRFGYRVMNNPENFEFIHDSNIEYKRKGDKKARYPFKIMDNAISGQMKQKNSTLYDPMSNNAICINGQLLLLDLIEHLEPYCKLIQNNTDGILVQLYSYDDFDMIDDVVWEWEQRTGMKMDFDTFIGDLYQKDVNNYLIIDRQTGDYKAKGGYVKPLSDLDYDLPIVNKALFEYMVHNVPVEYTVNTCNVLKEFQLVTKASSKYDCLIQGAEYHKVKKDGKTCLTWDKKGTVIKEKCVRIFASLDESDGGIVKIKTSTKTPEKVSNSPDHCFIFNDDVNGVRAPDKLDKQWYINLANKRLNDFGVY